MYLFLAKLIMLNSLTLNKSMMGCRCMFVKMENLINQLLHNPSHFKAQGSGRLWGWRACRGFPREPSVGTTGPDGL